VNALINAALSRPRTIVSLLVLILIAGTVSYINIPKESDPDINIPIIYVSMTHEGISPDDAERLLIRPMEQELKSIEGVKEMTSTAYQGGANVLLEFDAGFNPDTAIEDVRTQVDLARPELPDETDEPTVNEVNLSLFPIIVVTLSLNATSSFTSYNKYGFSHADQVRLAETFRRLDKRGCYVMLSNSSAPVVSDLYAGYQMTKIKARRSINSKADGRGPVTELLITNGDWRKNTRKLTRPPSVGAHPCGRPGNGTPNGRPTNGTRYGRSESAGTRPRPYDYERPF
jgi:hypothetical protein